MTKEKRDMVTPELVARWFDEATKLKGEPIPSSDLPSVITIAKYIDNARKSYRLQLTKAQQKDLIDFNEKFSEFYKKAIEFHASAQDLLNHCHPDHDYDLVHRLSATLEFVGEEWVDDPAPEITARSTWHLWAWILRSMALSAWQVSGVDRSPINKDNPMTRFLALALEAIDGKERSGGTIEQALRRMREKDDAKYAALSDL